MAEKRARMFEHRCRPAGRQKGEFAHARHLVREARAAPQGPRDREPCARHPGSPAKEPCRQPVIQVREARAAPQGPRDREPCARRPGSPAKEPRRRGKRTKKACNLICFYIQYWL